MPNYRVILWASDDFINLSLTVVNIDLYQPQLVWKSKVYGSGDFTKEYTATIYPELFALLSDKPKWSQDIPPNFADVMDELLGDVYRVLESI
jgi:hypothetical protein